MQLFASIEVLILFIINYFSSPRRVLNPDIVHNKTLLFITKQLPRRILVTNIYFSTFFISEYSLFQFLILFIMKYFYVPGALLLLMIVFFIGALEAVRVEKGQFQESFFTEIVFIIYFCPSYFGDLIFIIAHSLHITIFWNVQLQREILLNQTKFGL